MWLSESLFGLDRWFLEPYFAVAHHMQVAGFTVDLLDVFHRVQLLHVWPGPALSRVARAPMASQLCNQSTLENVHVPVALCTRCLSGLVWEFCLTLDAGHEYVAYLGPFGLSSGLPPLRCFETQQAPGTLLCLAVLALTLGTAWKTRMRDVL